jgi:anthranilate synthase component 1
MRQQTRQRYFPDLQEFLKKVRGGNLIPVYREILADMETPVSAFMKLAASKYCFLLESIEGGEKWARYSFIGINPAIIFTSKGRRVTIRRGSEVEEKECARPLDELRLLMQRYHPVEMPGLPRFYGGAVGYIGYDMVRFFERLPELTDDDLGWNDACLMITDTLLIFDNLRHTMKVVCNVHIDEDDTSTAAYDAALSTIEQVVALLHKPAKRSAAVPQAVSGSVTSNFEKKEFKRIVEQAKAYIRAGDIIQVVLSQRFETEMGTDPLSLYRALRIVNPSPYMYCIRMDKEYIIGSSPEVLVRLENDEIVVRPIAGTRPRGKDDRQDRAFEEDLKGDPKEVAEHIMLVDLGRNDVGRVAEMGSVRVEDFLVVERYSHVMHLVSSVRGKLKKGCDGFDLFAASFPAGTVSGAPKIRAMEIIEELENQKRGPYAGAVGYFSFSGNMDLCITIRTMFIKNGKIYFQAGAGIVMDSKPEKEYVETVNKAKAMVRAIARAHEGL